ncbi:hypothetical protein EK904_001960 [Melospiza melodia maxima]|nr:hypothetical protein EK904_001960 [Melospiza melodia maxima]
MYTAGLAPFYASNFSLWSAAYCSASGPAAGGCFPLDAAAAKKPKDLKFGIDRILSAEFDPKVKEGNTRQTGVHLPNLQPSAGQFFASLDPINEASAILGPLNTNPRSSVQHQFQDTFPGPYAVLTKDTLPQTYKRKRSWSRAVFSNLQRKGLEKRFEIQKYVTKPDRKQLAAMLGLTDAQWGVCLRSCTLPRASLAPRFRGVPRSSAEFSPLLWPLRSRPGGEMSRARAGHQCALHWSAVGGSLGQRK